MKLNTKINIFVLGISLIPLLFFGFFTYINEIAHFKNATFEHLDTIAQIQKNRLEDTINAKKDLVSLFVSKPLIRSYLHDYNTKPTASIQKSMNDNLLQAREGSVGIKKIFISNLSGKIISSTDSNLLGIDVSAEDYFKNGLDQTQLTSFRKDSDGKVYQYLSSPLILKEKNEGVVVLVVNAQDIIGLANDYTGLGKTGETLIAIDDGKGDAMFITPVRFDKNAALTRVVEKTRQDIPSVHAVAGEEKFFDTLVDYRNIPVFAATRFIKSTGWGIVVKIDREEAMAPVNTIINLFVILITCITLLVILLTFRITRSITAKEEKLDKAKNEFISLASHQLKTPITSVSWMMESLLDGDKGPLNEEQKKSVEKVYSINKNMLDLVGGFLDIKKIESGGFETEKEPVNLIEISDSLLEEISNQIINKKINIIKKYGENIPHPNIGPKTATIILQNLFTNAIKYTPENGTVEIQIERNNKGVLISVKDNGYGIPEEDKGHIFMKLFRASNVIQKEPSGTGLGLYLLKTLVNNLGGKVWFESKENQGSTFYVSLK